jgi:hydroxypyruvate isomerase
MRFSVCVDAVFKGQDFAESLRQIRAAGLGTFEFWAWWNKDLAAIKREMARLDMACAAFCTRFISLVDPAQREAYLAGLRETIAVARDLGCRTLISQVGSEIPDVPREQQRASLIAGLAACVPYLDEARITLVFEPLNILVDHPGYYLSRSDEAFEVAAAVGSPWVKVLFDIYHQQITEGHLIARIRENIAQIGHFHAAGNPGRHELDNGEINYPEVFRAISQTTYPGSIGLEYRPLEDPAAGLRRWATFAAG